MGEQCENVLQDIADLAEQDTEQALGLLDAPLENACLGLRAVAEALQDFDLYEQSLLIKSPVPNTLQMERLIDYALDLDEFERAEQTLATIVYTKKTHSKAQHSGRNRLH